MSLDNVYYWEKDGWKKITAEEFTKNHSNLKVSEVVFTKEKS